MTSNAAITLDITSIVVVISTLAGLLPPMAALLTIVWMGINIYESKTFQRWFKKKASSDDQT